jgi:hypothetical protein
MQERSLSKQTQQQDYKSLKGNTKHEHKGCVWFAFLGESGPRGAGERRLIVCTAPRARLSGCIFLPLACIPETSENGRSAEPGSAHATVSLTNDVLVYN